MTTCDFCEAPMVSFCDDCGRPICAKHNDADQCPKCDGTADEDDPNCEECMDAGCTECTLKDHSPLCPPMVARDDGGTDEINF